MKTIFPNLKGEGQFDEGLVPMDVGDRGLIHLIFNRIRANVSK